MWLKKSRIYTPINTVLPSTAGHPPPSDRSRTIGRLSLTITLLRRRVTSTQCLPLFNSRYTLCACLCSLPSPEVAMTCRYIPSWPINLFTARSADVHPLLPVLQLSFTYAIVRPANAPPSNTKISAVVKYIHKLGSSGEISSSVRCSNCFTGAALASESWPSPMTTIFTSPRTADRVVVYPLLECLPVVTARLELMVAAQSPRNDLRHQQNQRRKLVCMGPVTIEVVRIRLSSH